MTPGRPGPAAPFGESGRPAIDVLVVSLGTTLGLRVADDQLVTALRGAGLTVELARAAPPRQLRTLMLTDFAQARAAGVAARQALERWDPRRIIYSTTTAALFWPRPGAIRFDALAQATRPGRHGLWQRRLELRRLRQSPLLMPWDIASLEGAPADIRAQPHVVLPIAIGGEPALVSSGGAVDEDAGPRRDARARADAVIDAAVGPGSTAAAVTYAADASKKGLDRILAAWSAVRRPGETLLVTGRSELPAGYGSPGGVVCTGRLEPAEFRALVRAVGVLVMAPRREDYGLVQLEALAEGARVATCAAPGPYAALPLVRVLWPEQVVEDGDDPAALGGAIRHAIDARPDAEDLLRATAAARPWRAAAVRELVERELVPALMA